jgi:hypothetical protein
MFKLAYLAKISTMVNKRVVKIVDNGSFTLVEFVSKIVGDFAPRLYLPWPPWVAGHR